jgi:hypothetical protein
MRKGKLAGLAVDVGLSHRKLARALDAMVDQHVDIVVADSGLSHYMTDDDFGWEIWGVDRVADAAHERGLKLVWYLASLEVVTIDGSNRPRTMAKDHPDWLQVGIDGTKNVFYGGLEDWVGATDESAWLCPRSGYREYFLRRVEQLARTGLDALWIDVPVFMQTGAPWTCHCEHHQRDFSAAAGTPLPRASHYRGQWIGPIRPGASGSTTATTTSTTSCSRSVSGRVPCDRTFRSSRRCSPSMTTTR